MPFASIVGALQKAWRFLKQERTCPTCQGPMGDLDGHQSGSCNNCVMRQSAKQTMRAYGNQMEDINRRMGKFMATVGPNGKYRFDEATGKWVSKQ